MNKLVTFIIATFICASTVCAQEGNPDVVFSKFKLEWFSIMGMRGGNGQRLKLTFNNTSDKTLKYVNVRYWAINSVNDIETDQFNRRDFSVNSTGPFKPNEKRKLEVEIALFHPNLLKAYPYKLEITYMNGEEKEIELNKNNMGQIFPCVEFINIERNEVETKEVVDSTENNTILGHIDGIECRIMKKYNNGVAICTSQELSPDQIRKAKEFFSLKGKIEFNLEGHTDKGDSYAGIDDGYIIFYKENVFIKL